MQPLKTNRHSSPFFDKNRMRAIMQHRLFFVQYFSSSLTVNKPALPILASFFLLPSVAQAAQGTMLFPGADLFFLCLCFLLALATFHYKSQCRRAAHKEGNQPGQRSLEQQIVQQQPREQMPRVAEQSLSQDWENFNRMQSEFIANINHEVRTPMNAIIGYTEMLSVSDIGQKEKRFVSIIHKSSMALVAIFNDIMELSKIDSGRLQIMARSIRLQTVINEVDNLFQETVREKQLRFSCQIAPALPQVFILDGVRLKQILQNLVSNAIKFTPKGYVQLTVDGQPSLTRPDCYDLRFQVKDSGVGIPEAEQQKIFKLFQQYEKVVPKQYGGIGLGLTLCSRLVAMMGGSIDLTSREGRGSCFTVCLNTLPCAVQAADVFPEQTPAASQEQSDTILVVDDMDLIKDVFIDYFRGSSFKILTANDNDQALEICRREKPDMIFMDLNLAGMDGRTVTLNLRKLEGMKEVPVIVMTGEVLEEDEYRPMFDGLLQKPFRLEELKALVVRSGGNGARPVDDRTPDDSQQRELEAITELWTEELEQLRLTAFNSGNLSVTVALGEALRRAGKQHDQSLLVDMGNELIRCATEPDIAGVDRLLVRLAQRFAPETV